MVHVKIVVDDSLSRYAALFALAVISLIVMVYVKSPFVSPFVFSILLILWAVYHTYSNRSKLSAMCCMMSGMVFGVISGFFIGTLTALATADFLIGIVAGTIAGLLVGVPLGKMGAGGHLGRMEGIMGGPMGGIMGGMLGVMIRFYNLELFMPFFMFVIILTAWEMIYAINRDTGKTIPKTMLYLGILLSVLGMVSSVIGDYTGLESNSAFPKTFAVKTQQENAALNGNVQEITIKAGALGYNPNYIVVKKNMPVKLNLKAEPGAGCTRSFVFPDFGIKKLLPQGGSDTVEFTPQKAGNYQFRCSMAMASGTLVVQ